MEIWDLGPVLLATRDLHLTGSLSIALLVFLVDYVFMLSVFMKIKGEKIQAVLSLPDAPALRHSRVLAILNFYHFPKCPFTLLLVFCDKCFFLSLPFLPLCSTPCPIPDYSSL